MPTDPERLAIEAWLRSPAAQLTIINALPLKEAAHAKLIGNALAEALEARDKEDAKQYTMRLESARKDGEAHAARLRAEAARIKAMSTPKLHETIREALSLLQVTEQRAANTAFDAHEELRARELPKPPAPSFKEAWKQKESEGYQYGRDALEQVRFGWDIREAYAEPQPEIIEAKGHRLVEQLHERYRRAGVTTKVYRCTYCRGAMKLTPPIIVDPDKPRKSPPMFEIAQCPNTPPPGTACDLVVEPEYALNGFKLRVRIVVNESDREQLMQCIRTPESLARITFEPVPDESAKSTDAASPLG